MSQTATASQPPSQADAPQGDLLEKTIEATRDGVEEAVAKRLRVSSTDIYELLRNVWTVTKGQKPLTKLEMFEGMSMIARFDLDPISREIYVTRDNKGRLMTLIAIDGWVKILDRTDHYDGQDVTIKFQAGKEGDLSAVVSVTTEIFSKTRSHPAKYEAFAAEYANLGGFMLDKIPLHMLRIFSLRHAARLFTPLGGSVMLREELEWIKRESDPAAPATGPSHEDQAEAAAAAREPQAKTPEPPPAPEATPEPPQQDSEADQEAAVVRAQLMEEFLGMIEAAESKGDVDNVEKLVVADTVLHHRQRDELREACGARKIEIHDSRGPRAPKARGKT